MRLGAIKVLSLMEHTGKKLSELKAVIKHFPQALINVSVTAEGKIGFYTDEELAYAVKEEMRKLGDKGRILVRPSGTEPLIRVMAEGEDEAQINETANKIAKLVKKNLG